MQRRESRIGKQRSGKRRQRATWARLVHEDGLELEVDVDRLKVGDTISVHEGEIVPVDGVISAGPLPNSPGCCHFRLEPIG